MDSFGITSNHIEKINSVFHQYININEVILFGSRAKGNYRANSDIDLAIKGKNINLTTLQEIENKLEDLYLPYYIDLIIYDTLNNSDLINHINRIGKQFYLSN
ncbi:nucleotidyltransferase domain-containing protein [Flavobacterium sp. SUN046]|uniref:nucleotidyltransferase family protein n=1 Tax=Flavobacterium sp. SUN046 TaxID=3002440 RepID=UPI002DB61827|nr:nucleotidyltransferase domain-containing protein [Flavobacterium sp. SUN046]MEC4048390.1 nucleotidyltransferase domain-containing protein [Flavobacterium sp. SUN046]